MDPAERLRPYVAGLAVTWTESTPDVKHRGIDGTLVFVDISGFTTLTERLAAKGKVGAEEMSDLLNASFATLLEVAYGYGASLVKWGGDAVLLLYEGPDHAAQACRGAFEMQRTMRRIGRLRTSAGVVQLRMSVGISSGTFDFFLVGDRHRELLVAGPTATETAVMEQIAEAGEVVISASTVRLLPADCVGAAKDAGWLLRTAPPADPRSRWWPHAADLDSVAGCLDPALREHLLTEVGESEHRQVAVGFVEVSGVDAVLDRDGPSVVGDALHDLLVVVQQECAHHEVTFWETDISKDGFKIMLVAGAPRSSGRDEEGMLRTARTIADRHVGPLAIRIGVNVGRVFNGGFGPPFRRTWSVKGDAINLAARVMGKSGPGEVWATDAALTHCPGVFATEPIEPFMVKGKALPVHAHRVLAVSDAASAQAQEMLPLLGRDRELATLGRAAAGAREGRGSVVEVVGEPGIGKSRLVLELRTRCPDLRQVALVCDAYQSSTPYAPFRALLRELLDVPAGASAQDAGAALTRVLEQQAPELLGWAPLLAVVIGAHVAATAETDAIDEQFRRTRLEQVTVELLRRLLPKPSLLVVEDAHLSDAASADLLTYLCGQVEDAPWAVLVTRRTSPGGFAPDAPADRIDLVPLDADSAHEMLAALSEDAPLRPHEMTTLAQRAEGNPLFLLQLVEAARHSGSVDDLPDSVEGVIIARIDQLPPADRRVLRMAAVLGTRFEGWVLDRMLAQEADALSRHVLDEYLERTEGGFAFRHALVRDTAYEGLPYTRRKQLHALAGTVLEQAYGGSSDERPDLLSLHFFEADDFARAWRYALSAGTTARTASAYSAAATYYQRALAASRHLVLPAVEVAQVHESLGDARLRLGEFDLAHDAYRHARAGYRADPLQLARTQLRTAQAADLAASYPSALRWLSIARRSLDTLADGTTAAELRAEIDGFYGLVRHRQGRDVDAVRWCRRAVAEAERVQALRPLAAALVHLDVCETLLGRGDGSNAVRALELWQELGDAWQEARAHNNLGIRAYYGGRWDDAVRHYDLAGDAALRAGDEWMATIASANVAEILSDQGRWREAEPRMHEVLRTLRATGARGALSFGQSLMGRLLARKGSYAEALVLYLSARRLQAEDGEQALLVETNARMAECLVWCGRPAEALEMADKALAATASVDGAAAQVPLLQRVRAMALAALDREDEATAAAADSLAASLERDAPHERVWTLNVVLALATSPDHELIEQRDALADQLGIVDLPPAVAGTPVDTVVVPDLGAPLVTP